MNGLKTAEVETIKAFLSTQKDRYRPPYGKQAQDFYAAVSLLVQPTVSMVICGILQVTVDTGRCP